MQVPWRLGVAFTNLLVGAELYFPQIRRFNIPSTLQTLFALSQLGVVNERQTFVQ